MADDAKTTDQRKATPRSLEAGSGAGRAAAPPGASEGGATRTSAPPTEKPVKTQATVESAQPGKATTEYAVTVDNRTGLPVMIQKVDESTGEKQELTASDYAALYYGGTGSSPGGASITGGSSAMDTDTLAYYQGMADAANAASAGTGGSFDAAGGFADAFGGYSDPYGGYSDAAGGYSDAYGGYTDSSGGYFDAAGGYADALGGYSDPYGGYADPSGGYFDATGGYADALGGYSDPYGGYTDAFGNYHSPV